MTNWRGVWAVFCGGLVAGAYMTKVPPALPQLRAELDLSLIASTFIVTTFNVLGMLVGMLAGMLGDRYGRKRLALIGLALMALGGVLGALVDDFAPLLGSRFIEGVGFILFAGTHNPLRRCSTAARTARHTKAGSDREVKSSGIQPAVISTARRLLSLSNALRVPSAFNTSPPACHSRGQKVMFSVSPNG